MNRNFVIWLGRISVSVESPVDLVTAWNRLGAMGAQPLFEVRPNSVGGAYRVAYRESTGAGIVRVDCGIRRLTLSCPAPRLGAGEPLLTVAGALLERRLNLAGCASMIAACVHLAAGGVLLLGGPGAGKTSIAIALCRGSGGRLMANDYCVVGAVDETVHVLAGSKTIGVREVALRRHLPELANRLQRAAPRTSGWWPKTLMSPAALDIAVATVPMPLVGAYVVNVDDQAQLTVVALPPSHARHALYETVSRTVRGSSVALLAGDDGRILGYLPSLDSPACHARRVKLIDVLTREVGIVLVSGRLSQVAEWIADDAHHREPS